MLIHWIGPYAPVPGETGADLRSFYLLRELSRRGATVKGWFLDSHGNAVREHLREFHQLESSPVRTRLRAGLLRLKGVPLTVGRRWHPGFREAFNGDADLVYVDHLHLNANVPEDYDGPVWLDEHNLEYRLWQQYAATRNFPLRWAMDYEASAVKNYELDQIRRFTGVGLPSEKERGMVPDSLQNKVTLVPNGVSEEWLQWGRRRLEEDRSTVSTLGFIGEYDWPPNRAGVETFLESVWEDLRADHENLELMLAGKNPAEHWSEVAGVTTTGYVESSRTFFDRIDALIVPLTMGAGTRLKVLEAMARGVPLVGTEKGVEDIEVDPGFVVGTVPEMEVPLRKMIANPSVGTESARSHHQHVRDHYRWSDIGEKLWARLKEIGR